MRDKGVTQKEPMSKGNIEDIGARRWYIQLYMLVDGCDEDEEERLNIARLRT